MAADSWFDEPKHLNADLPALRSRTCRRLSWERTGSVSEQVIKRSEWQGQASCRRIVSVAPYFSA